MLANFLSQLFIYFMPNFGLVWVQNSLDRHHGTLTNPPVRFLLTHRPFGCLPCQTPTIGFHESPGTIEEPADNINRTFVKAFARDFLRVIESISVNISVPMFTPSPIL
jgi:hypothetical protein